MDIFSQLCCVIKLENDTSCLIVIEQLALRAKHSDDLKSNSRQWLKHNRLWPPFPHSIHRFSWGELIVVEGTELICQLQQAPLDCCQNCVLAPENLLICCQLYLSTASRNPPAGLMSEHGL